MTRDEGQIPSHTGGEPHPRAYTPASLRLPAAGEGWRETAVAGVVMASTGFSGLAMAITMPAQALLLVWMCTLGVWMWCRGGGLPEEPTV